MKKILAVILSLALVVTMGTAVFADGEKNGLKSGDEVKIDVSAKYNDGVNTPTKYSVDVSWGEMEFTYSVGGTLVWDAETHDYSMTDASQNWSAEGNTVTVVNHSNIAITAEFEYESDEDYKDVTGSFDKESIEIKSAENVKTDAESLKEVTGTATLTLSGSIDSSLKDFTKVGVITVKIS